MVFHFGNAWQPNDHTIIIEGSAVERKDNDPFNTLHRKNMQSAKDLANENGSKFKRYKIDLEKRTFEMDDLISMPKGYVEFPTFNNHLKGIKNNRFSYLN